MKSDIFTSEDYSTFQAAIDKWGIDAQAEMAEEEAAEFIVASKHWARGKAEPEEVIDELADIRIMAEQLSQFIGKDAVDERTQEKMDRLRERLESE